MKLHTTGVDETIENLKGVAQKVDDISEPMRQSTLLVTGSAKKNAPVDRGVLRASITPGVRDTGLAGMVGVVGSNVEYAAAMELGMEPHFVPLKALKGWARRHGISAWLVQQAIAARGTKARRYLQKAFNTNKSRIIRIFNDYIKRITK
jgi:HK97 gp10 family phage protein